MVKCVPVLKGLKEESKRQTKKEVLVYEQKEQDNVSCLVCSKWREKDVTFPGWCLQRCVTSIGHPLVHMAVVHNLFPSTCPVPLVLYHHEVKARILKHIYATPPLCKKALYKFTRIFEVVFTVLKTEWLDFYVIKWRNTLENPTIHLCRLGK